METVEVTWGRVGKVWWCLLWRAYLGCLCVLIAIWGIATGVAFCAYKLIGETPGEYMETPLGIVGTGLLIYISLVVVRFALKKRYSDFEIVLVARDHQTPKAEQKQ